jgi:CMP-N-acetylneuraminic acid synthetase
LAVVPARGGSEGIPRKNLCKVGGLSLIAHVARTIRALDWIDRAVLTTDDPEMAEEGRQHGLEVPFLRPAELATDSSGPNDM